jgi:hypothetical protein
VLAGEDEDGSRVDEEAEGFELESEVLQHEIGFSVHFFRRIE